MKEIATAFVKAKRAFSPALKDKTNPAFRSKYADLGACLEAVNDALLENGIALTQRTLMDEHGITVETVLMHESGESMSSGPLHVPATKQDAQGFGSAMTYARRYSLMAVCGIAPEDDDGNAAAKRPAARPIEVGQPGAITGVKAAALAASGELPDMAHVDRLAANIVENFTKIGPKRSAQFIAQEELDDVQTIYLSTKLPSNINSAIKKAREEIRNQQKETA